MELQFSKDVELMILNDFKPLKTSFSVIVNFFNFINCLKINRVSIYISNVLKVASLKVLPRIWFNNNSEE